MKRVLSGMTNAGKEIVNMRPSRAISHISGEKVASDFPQMGPPVDLHGDIHLTIHRAYNLPNLDTVGRGLSDPYVRVFLDGKKSVKTKTVQNCLHPSWNEEFIIKVHGKIHTLSLVIKDEDLIVSEFIGALHLPIGMVISGLTEAAFVLIPQNKGTIVLSASYVDSDHFKNTPAVTRSEWPVRDGCFVTLYQDAHCLAEDRQPPIKTSAGQWVRQSFAYDVYDAICNAQKFIYITGWSLWTDLKLIRDNSGVAYPTLGELLKMKAAEGVRVLLLLWDEMLTLDNKLLNQFFTTTKDGVMCTWDEETKKYFEGSGVICELVYRQGNVGENAANGVIAARLNKISTPALFTHHQKSIIVDGKTRDGRRRVLAFVGGIDLSNGRWDTQQHSLFDTLQTLHKGDVLMRIPGADDRFGPRQPWHDIHAKLEGPIARDVMLNFEQRWHKQANKTYRDKLIVLSGEFIQPHEEAALFANNPARWSVQMFRSIDHNSARLQDGAVERSILEAYVHQIRRAEKFIYIENQYFLGSSGEWEANAGSSVPCKHPIPAEIVQKIIRKIKRNEKFCVYVLIPLHPEGLPDSSPVQAILHWQYKTFEMMYLKINRALEEAKSTRPPTDYLSVFCLGNREPAAAPPRELPLNDRQRVLFSSRRHMIYVHSKMMIVDDEYIIVGSANINERSMSGDRDTEIAVGMMQPAFCAANQHSTQMKPKGDVYGFRLSLWHEHLGVLEDSFERPENPECMRRLRQLGEYNWSYYFQPHTTKLAGHLLLYPYEMRDGVFGVPPNYEYLPDTFNALTAGAMQTAIPDIVTT